MSGRADELGPLVEPGPELTRDELERYHRHLLLPEIGAIGQRRLKAARVLVIGAGGLGAPVLTYLAAAGVGTIGLVDDDRVDASNLQRQVLFEPADVGRPKTAAAAARLRALNPWIHVVEHPVRVAEDNALELFSGYDLVVDGADNFATRYLVNDACVILGLPYVWGSVLRFEGQVSVFWERRGPQYRDLYPEPPPAGLVPSCAEGGVLGALCAMVGATMASEAVKLIVGTGRPLLGWLLLLDALELRWRSLPLQRQPDTLRVSSLREWDYAARCSPQRDAALDQAADRGHEISAAQLRQLLQSAPAGQVALVDVREPFEHELAAIPGSILIPRADLATAAGRDRLRGYEVVVLYCKSGARSRAAMDGLRSGGFSRVHSLSGGIDSWLGSQQQASAQPRNNP